MAEHRQERDERETALQGPRPVALTAPPAAEPERDEGLHRSAWRWVRAAAITITLFVGWQLVLVVQTWVVGLLHVILFVVFGAVLALIAAPAVEALQRYARLPRTLAALLMLLTEVAVVGGLVYLISGPLVSEGQSLAKQVPNFVDRLSRLLTDLETRLGAQQAAGKTNSLLNAVSSGGNLPSQVGSLVLRGVTGAVTALVDTVVTLVTAFWLLKDGLRLRAGLLSMLPGRVRPTIEFGLEATGVVIGGYVRAQLFMAFLIGLLAWAGTTALGVPFPLVVGVAAGVFELVPLVGPFIGGAVAVLLALTVTPLLAVWTVILFIGIHVVEGYILSPRIQARFVQLHPLVAFLALIAGVEVNGFLGAVFAVPAASLVAVFVRATLGDWRANHPDLFAAGASDEQASRRREIILGDFRFFGPSPMADLRREGDAWRRSLARRAGAIRGLFDRGRGRG